MNASAALDIEPKKIVESIDSVSLGFSKVLCRLGSQSQILSG